MSVATDLKSTPIRANNASKNCPKKVKPSCSAMVMELHSRNRDFRETFEMSAPESESADKTSPAQRERRTYIRGDASVKTIFESLYQKLSMSRENGTMPGPSKLYSGIAATSLRVMLAKCIHHGASTQTSLGEIPTVSMLYRISRVNCSSRFSREVVES